MRIESLALDKPTYKSSEPKPFILFCSVLFLLGLEHLLDFYSPLPYEWYVGWRDGGAGGVLGQFLILR